MAGAAYGAIASIGRTCNATLRSYAPKRLRAIARPRADHGDGSARCEAPCHWLCMGCGWLVPQAAPTRGYRGEASLEPSPRPEVCAGCGARTWVDLRDAFVVDQLADQDDRHRRDHVSLWVPVVLALDIVAVIMGVAALPMVHFVPPILLLLTIAFGHALYLANRLAEDPLPRRTPARWRRATAPVGFAVGSVTGPARAAADDDEPNPLLAPLSGRPCLAYELTVREADVRPQGDADWLLIEQRAAAMVVDGRRLDGEGLSLASPGGARVSVARDHLAATLRRRGLVLPREEHRWVVSERIVQAGDVVTVECFSDGAVLSVPAALASAV